WACDDIRAALQDACEAAGLPTFTPHALRRAFATDAASALPRHVVALAGGWRGVERLDDHYVQPRPPTIWKKLAGVMPPPGETHVQVGGASEAALFPWRPCTARD